MWFLLNNGKVIAVQITAIKSETCEVRTQQLSNRVHLLWFRLIQIGSKEGSGFFCFLSCESFVWSL